MANTDKPFFLSFGGGQDSTAILFKAILDPEFKARFCPGRLVVIMSDTGNEHPATYHHVAAAFRFARSRGVETFFLTSSIERAAKALGVTIEEAKELGAEEGYHSEAWPTLTERWVRDKQIMSTAYRKSCTSNLKIEPIYRFIEQWIGREYGLEAAGRAKCGRLLPAKAAPKLAARFGKFVQMIGIAKGEETRVSKAADPLKWREKTFDRAYPLIDIGFGRKECQEYIASVVAWTGVVVPAPSNCMFCPFLSPIELLWLARKMPEAFEEWVEHEDRKLAAWEGRKDSKGNVLKNFGVYKEVRLRDALAKAELKHGHMTTEELDEYKMSHGHCVQSKY